MSKIKLIESDIQILIVEYFSLICRKYNFMFFSVPNEALLFGVGTKKNNFGKIMKLKKMGMQPGASDLVIGHKGKMYCMEVKRPGKKLNENQKDFKKWAVSVGAEYSMAQSLNEAKQQLIIWGITK